MHTHEHTTPTQTQDKHKDTEVLSTDCAQHLHLWKKAHDVYAAHTRAMQDLHTNAHTTREGSMTQKLQHGSHPLLCVERGDVSPLIHSFVVRYSSTHYGLSCNIMLHWPSACIIGLHTVIMTTSK